MFSDFLIEHGLESDSEDNSEFADMRILYGDTIGSVVSYYAELQRAMRPWENPRQSVEVVKPQDVTVLNRRKESRRSK